MAGQGRARGVRIRQGGVFGAAGAERFLTCPASLWYVRKYVQGYLIHFSLRDTCFASDVGFVAERIVQALWSGYCHLRDYGERAEGNSSLIGDKKSLKRFVYRV